MPIYAYRCEACGFAKDALQKMSDAPLTECPACGKSTLKKQVTAAGFQLKGTGWYVTDFRGGQGGKSAPSTAKNAGNQVADQAANSGTSNASSSATDKGGSSAASSDAGSSTASAATSATADSKPKTSS